MRNEDEEQRAEMRDGLEMRIIDRFYDERLS